MATEALVFSASITKSSAYSIGWQVVINYDLIASVNPYNLKCYKK